MSLTTTLSAAEFPGLAFNYPGWKLAGYRFDASERTIFFQMNEEEDLLIASKCPHCDTENPVSHGHLPERTWRHLDAFGLRTALICAIPRGKCRDCSRVFGISPPWQGKSKHFSIEFEAFLLTLIKELPVKAAAKIVGETDQRVWRMLFAHVDSARSHLSIEVMKMVRQQWQMRTIQSNQR